MAEENVDELIGSPSRVLWNLVDNLGTTRDILRNDATLATHFTYDANGNRTNTGYATGANNQLANDGTFSYTYDAEGNRTRRTDIASGAVTEYAWDHRNRLTSITDYANSTDADAGANATQVVMHDYDVYNQWVGRQVDTDGNGVVDERTRFIYDAGQIVLQLDDADANGVVEDDEISHRYLWGDAVDQLFADEQVSGTTISGDVLWPLTDNLGSVRDIAEYDAATDATTIISHITYDSFGQVVSETNAAVDLLFGYTGRALDEYTGQQNNLNRWYDAPTGRWLSEDPIGFTAGDANLSRYVGNGPTNATDPSGLEDVRNSRSNRWSIGAGEARPEWEPYEGREDWSQPWMKFFDSLAASGANTAWEVDKAFIAFDQGLVGMFSCPESREEFQRGWHETRVQPLADRVIKKGEFRGRVPQNDPAIWYSIAEDLAVGRLAEGLGGAQLTGEPLHGLSGPGVTVVDGSVFEASTWMNAASATGEIYCEMGPQSQHLTYGISDTIFSATGMHSMARYRVFGARNVSSRATGATASTRTAIQRSLTERIADFRANPKNWQRVSASAEQATARTARGGVSIENVYRNAATGETLHVHDVFKASGGQISKHPSFRGFGKGQ